MKATDIFLAILVAFIWGLNFVVIKIGLDSFPPILFSALRFTCAAFPAVIFVSRGNIKWRWIISIGIVLGIIMFSLLFIGMANGISAGLSSIVLQIQAVFTVVLTAILLRDPPNKFQKIGILVAFAGIGILAIDQYETSSFKGFILIVSSGFAWAVSNIIMKRCGNINMFRLMIWSSLIPPIPLIIISLLFEKNHIQALSSISLTGYGSILYTGLLSTVFAFSIWGKLLQKYSPNEIAPFSLLVPIFGIICSATILTENLSYPEIIASIISIVGLSIIVLGRNCSKLSANNNIKTISPNLKT